MKVFLVYPHQLFSNFYESNSKFYLVEDPLFFTQYKFHKQKLILHRASMKSFAEKRELEGSTVIYVEYSKLKNSGDIADILSQDGVSEINSVAFDDDWLEQRVSEKLKERSIKLIKLDNPHFLTPTLLLKSYSPKGEFFYFHDFYVQQRKRLKILMEGSQPVGGKWSFDSENRAKLPKSIHPPALPIIKSNPLIKEAIQYVQQNFAANPGFGENALYPTSRTEALDWVDNFFSERFENFGKYEDAISQREATLFHSVFTPFLNIGLVSPQEILDRALKIPAEINSKEGFIRQIIGWREFVRLIYLRLGRKQRSMNFLSNERPISEKFYNAQTGILPVDTVITRALNTGYCHHIERLMVLGNFMLLCDIHPDAVYQWFMEMFVDSYDWVMVPNVYGMSQYADGGLMTTKPYVSGSNYILKMSDFKKGPWCEIWDSLYWRFIDKHYDLIKSNPRLSMIASVRDKLQRSGELSLKVEIGEKYLVA